MANSLKHSWAALGLASFLVIASCGPFKVEHDVSGTVQVPVNIQLNPEMFVPYFLTDCQARTSGQLCYDPEPAKCASCMAHSIFTYLTAGHPLPSPTPSVTP